LREIHGEAKTIRQLLQGSRYAIDYYQREYRWEPKQVEELLTDLTEKFLDDHEAGHERTAVEGYGHYFLGSIILSDRDGRSYIIDGQQRLTTLTLLLIYLHRQEGGADVDDLIFSTRYGRKSFNIDEPERAVAMEALYNGNDFDPTDQSESVRNIVARYLDIERLFPNEIDEHALPYFADWLIENVHLVEITAYSDDDAYTIFETMNDRGLSLAPLDMLKGYVLANITDEGDRLRANDRWKSMVTSLNDFEKDEAADAVKAWLRSQYADSIRERRRHAQPRDFDRVGTEFHRWVKENDDRIALRTSADFVAFVDREMTFYSRQYLRLRMASIQLTPGLETIYYNARLGFTLQYPLLLAPLSPDDSEEVVDRKLQVAASYVDILLARRIWNFRSIAYSTMQYAMFLATREVRRKNLPELVATLRSRLDDEQETFASNPTFRLHQMNRYQIQQLLARMTDFVERESGLASHFADYVAEGSNRFEVEHIWADHPERHEEEFAHPSEFSEYRNRIGGLLLLPKSFNASYGDLPYEEKLPHYFGQNLLAKSLHPDCYQHNPGFLRFIEANGLPFRPHEHFKKADLDARQVLYTTLAEQLWDPDRLERDAGLVAASAGAHGNASHAQSAE
jgi:Protein of unknown function DUF262/Protein of unknown function (DUF1524)